MVTIIVAILHLYCYCCIGWCSCHIACVAADAIHTTKQRIRLLLYQPPRPENLATKRRM